MLNYPAIDTTRGRKSPSGRTLWCGPFALAVLSGMSYDDAYAIALRRLNRWHGDNAAQRGLPRDTWKERSIQGLSHTVLPRIIGPGFKLTIKWTPTKRKDLTLLTFTRLHTVKGKTYLLVAGNHYVVVKDGVLYHSWHDPMPVEALPKYRVARVTRWAEVKPRPPSHRHPDGGSSLI